MLTASLKTFSPYVNLYSSGWIDIYPQGLHLRSSTKRHFIQRILGYVDADVLHVIHETVIVETAGYGCK